MSVGSDEGDFSFPEECRRPFPLIEGGGTIICKKTPPPLHSSPYIS